MKSTLRKTFLIENSEKAKGISSLYYILIHISHVYVPLPFDKLIINLKNTFDKCSKLSLNMRSKDVISSTTVSLAMTIPIIESLQSGPPA